MDGFKDILSMVLYMLAVRYDSTKQNQTIQKYLMEISQDLIITKEISKKVKKEHFHVYLTTKWKTKIESQKTAIRRKLRNYIVPEQYCVQTVKDYNKYMIYILKENDVIYSNIDKEVVKDFKNQSMEINKDKKLPVYKKLFNRWEKYDGNLSLYAWIANTLIIEFDTFCRRQQIQDYAAYIRIRQSNGKDTEIVLNEEYGLYDWKKHNEDKTNKWYKEQTKNI